jgi:SAM-dependent methyltransferase
MAQDSSASGFWDSRYRSGTTPWDAGCVPPYLESWLEARAPMRVLVPGCGSGYEIRAFVEHGHDVTAIEISEAAIATAAKALGPLATRVKKADFFQFDAPPFDLVYERAFLCALPRRLWPAWAARAAELVRPGGELAGFFYFDTNERGPPFGIAQTRLDELLCPSFELCSRVEIPQGDSIPVFKGKEVWQAWRRRL